MALSPKDSYFVPPNPVLGAVIITGLWMTWCVCFCPDQVPHSYLGPLGRLYEFLAYKAHPFWKYSILAFATTMHVTESAISLRLTVKKGISDPVARFKWWLAVLLFGIGSLRHLLRYKPEKV